ncbi:MAG: hypothetical protein ACRC6E_08020 [Fusobacteriaceae bacterium]
MKKRIFILAMAILSTSAFAELPSGTTGGSIDGLADISDSGLGNMNTVNISLVGRTIAPLTIEADNNIVDFGVVMVGKTSTAVVELTPKGESGANVSLVAKSSTPLVVPTLTDAGVVGKTSDMQLVYTPTKLEDTLSEASVTVTATYTD